jgi:membrane-associated PAP2 superfamily phosphatase
MMRDPATIGAGFRPGESQHPPPAHGQPPIWLPIAFLLVGSLAVRSFNLDLVVQRWFWSAEGGWSLKDSSMVGFLYAYGNLPAVAIGLSCLIAWIGSFVASQLRRVRFLTFYLVLALIIGPGLLVNAMLKDHYGRPRPREVAEFGGDQKFRPLGEPTFNQHGKSFPSGHAAMGFFWFVPGIYFWPRSRRLAWGLIGLALLHGGLMGFGRMAQGAHWPSDILWSAGIVYVSAWILYCILSLRLEQHTHAAPMIHGWHSSKRPG